MLLPDLTLTWVAPDDLRAGDVIVGNLRDGTCTAEAVKAIGAAFNPRFRPVVFASDPDVAIDFDRDLMVPVLRPPLTCTVRSSMFGQVQEHRAVPRPHEVLHALLNAYIRQPEFVRFA